MPMLLLLGLPCCPVAVLAGHFQRVPAVHLVAAAADFAAVLADAYRGHLVAAVAAAAALVAVDHLRQGMWDYLGCVHWLMVLIAPMLSWMLQMMLRFLHLLYRLLWMHS